jgi:hypothetical protein
MHIVLFIWKMLPIKGFQQQPIYEQEILIGIEHSLCKFPFPILSFVLMKKLQFEISSYNNFIGLVNQRTSLKQRLYLKYGIKIFVETK